LLGAISVNLLSLAFQLMIVATCVFVGIVNPWNDSSRGSIMPGCRHHKSRFHASLDPKTQVRSIDIRPGYRHGRRIDSFCNTRDRVSGRFSGRPRFCRTWLRWVIPEIFSRKRVSKDLEDLSTFSAHMEACLYVVSDVAQIFRPNLIR